MSKGKSFEHVSPESKESVIFPFFIILYIPLRFSRNVINLKS